MIFSVFWGGSRGLTSSGYHSKSRLLHGGKTIVQKQKKQNILSRGKWCQNM